MRVALFDAFVPRPCNAPPSRGKRCVVVRDRRARPSPRDPTMRLRSARSFVPSFVVVALASHAFAQEDTTQRVSVRESGAESAGISRAPGITAEGRVIVFQSLARNLVVGDSNGVADV